MNTNPIQTVLEAEKAAREAVEAAHQSAEKTLHNARSEARRLVERNEARTQQALEDYAEQSAIRLESEIGVLNREAQDAVNTFITSVKQHLPEIESEALDTLWPK